MAPYKRILVPLDGSATSIRGLDEAVRLAQHDDAQLRLLHVLEEMPAAWAGDGFVTFSADLFGVMKERGQGILQDARTRAVNARVAADTLLEPAGSPRVAERIVEAARDWKADLIVIGTHGRRGVEHFLIGSDAERVVRTAPVPVLLVPSKLQAD